MHDPIDKDEEIHYVAFQINQSQAMCRVTGGFQWQRCGAR